MLPWERQGCVNVIHFHVCNNLVTEWTKNEDFVGEKTSVKMDESEREVKGIRDGSGRIGERTERKKRQDERKKESEALGEEAPPKLLRILRWEETTTNDDENAEVQWDILNDEFKTYFDKSYVPKVIITSGDNPHTRTITFMKELSRMIPNAELFWRNRSAMKKMIEDGKERGYTDVVVIK
ncbi:RPF1 [Lepeophtheirus salmonis]|uniref:RPF1 n=1 Tax=Lepeophtheirus salmonis TaxID=72036 RepID=A0A7R8H723_LEPSM|nr:RPF1 [Lepeophtheirus salmonis]CAF2914824.1 RPF1 [Lepeophtheirus salmonis]